MDVRVDTAGGKNQAFAGDDFRGHANDHAGRYAGHDMRISRFSDGGNQAVLDADVGLVDAGVIDDHRVGDDAIQRSASPTPAACPMPSRMVLPPPNLHSSP